MASCMIRAMRKKQKHGTAARARMSVARRKWWEALPEGERAKQTEAARVAVLRKAAGRHGENLIDTEIGRAHV